MIYALMPVKNEADRYLQSCLTWLRPMVDAVWVYDDQSDDDSVEIARGLDCEVMVRPSNGTPFLEHEGRFRGECWYLFQEHFKPAVADWILAIDADEFLVDAEGRKGEGPGAVLGTLRGATLMQPQAVGIVLPIPEVFDVLAQGTPLVRRDGYWGSIRGPRLFRYQPDGLYQDKPMGCGAEPNYVARGMLSSRNYGLHLMHYGYANAEDRAAKYQRYTSLPDHGHNNGHVQSIMQVAHLENWNGQVADVWRGKR